jgi:hypothetical protein
MAASAMLAPVGKDHGMPEGMMGMAAEGPDFDGAPDLQAAISLVTAGGAPGSFSIVQALANPAGPDAAKAEVAKLSAQYGSVAVNSFVIVQNYAVNDAVKIATYGGIKFPVPTLRAHDDLAQALGVKTVQLAAFH